MTDPFAALGLPASPALTDEQVRAAWRAIAVATHPDREDGGDPARYAAASAAYAQLRTPWSRSETYADLTAGPGPAPSPTLTARPRAVTRTSVIRALLLLPARIRHGRPWHLAIRISVAILAAVIALRVPGSPPAAPALITGITTWLWRTGRADLAPPPGR